MSKTAELDKTIELLNQMLAKPKLSLKDKLAITDRIVRVQALKMKFADVGKGGKFAQPVTEPEPTGEPHAGDRPDLN